MILPIKKITEMIRVRHAMATDPHIKAGKVRLVLQETAIGRHAMEIDLRTKAVRAAHVRQETETDRHIKAVHAPEGRQETAAGLRIKAVHVPEGHQETETDLRIKAAKAAHVPEGHQAAAVLLLVQAAQVAHPAAHVEKMIKNLKLPAQEMISAIYGVVSSTFKRQAIKKIKKTHLVKKIAKLWTAGQEAANPLPKNYLQNVSNRTYH